MSHNDMCMCEYSPSDGIVRGEGPQCMCLYAKVHVCHESKPTHCRLSCACAVTVLKEREEGRRESRGVDTSTDMLQ